MLGWLSRLFTPPEPSRPRVEARLTQLENLMDDFDSRMDYVVSELKSLRGRLYSMKKSNQDDVGEAIDREADDEAVHRPPQRGFTTAHLSRRFKGA